jgi:hypothetical protein
MNEHYPAAGGQSTTSASDSQTDPAAGDLLASLQDYQAHLQAAGAAREAAEFESESAELERSRRDPLGYEVALRERVGDRAFDQGRAVVTALVTELRAFARQPQLDRRPAPAPMRGHLADGGRGTTRQPRRRSTARAAAASRGDPDSSDPEPPPPSARRRRRGNERPALPEDFRNIDSVTLAEAGVVVRGHTVVVPCRRSDGSAFRERWWRKGQGWRWDGQTGKGMTLVGLETLPPLAERVNAVLVIAEGESDMLAIREAFAVDRDGACVVVLAVPGASSWLREWVAHTEGFRRVYCAADGDAAGTQLLESVWESTPAARWLPITAGEDSRSILQGPAGRERFAALLDEADARAVLTAGFLVAPTIAEFELFVREVTA